MTAKLRQSPIQTENMSEDQKAFVHATLGHRFLRGLLAEWENALWRLPESIRFVIQKPLFSIREMPRRLGTWDKEKREITLSRDLVENGRWDDVREVLLHEMSHQVAHEGLKATSEPDHGKQFKKACRLLQANPKASGSFRALHERVHRGEALDDQDKIVVRIHKLMALAESSNLHEANAAMQKAHQLILHHNVDLIEKNIQQDYQSLFLGKPRLRHFREAYHLAHLLQDYYFVQGMWIEAWVLEKEKMGRVLEISGTRTNVRIADYVYDAVCRYIDTNWVDYRRDKQLNRYRKTDYAIGIVEGFRTTLEKTSAKGVTKNGGNLPVTVEDRALNRFMRRRYPNVRSFRRQGSGCDARVLRDGREKGRKLIVSKGITRKKEYQNQRLDYHGDTEQT